MGKSRLVGEVAYLLRARKAAEFADVMWELNSDSLRADARQFVQQVAHLADHTIDSRGSYMSQLYSQDKRQPSERWTIKKFRS